MTDFLIKCLIVCPLVFLGSFVDSIAGGGGIITLPAYLLAGLPAHTAAGTNKLVAAFGSVSASYKYFATGNVVLRIALLSGCASLVSAAVGSQLALFIPEDILQLIMVIVLPIVAVFLSLNKDFGAKKKRTLSPAAETGAAIAIGLVIGCYDGLIGPGTGTFLMLCFSGILGLDLLVSGGCAKVSNLASNLASTVVYLLNGKVMYAIAVPAILCSILGGWLGSRFAIKGGSKRIRKVMFLVLLMLLAKMVWDYFFTA